MSIGTAPFPAFDGTQACRELDPETFFPADSAATALDAPEAIRACRRCPFLRECLAYALTHDVQGVWGGTFYAQRDRIRKDNGIKASREGLFEPVSVRQGQVVQMKRGGGALK